MHYNTIDNEKVYKDGTFKCIHWKDLLEGYIQVPHTAAPRDREQESAVINNKIIRHKKHIITKCNLKCLNNEAISYHLKYILWHAEEDPSSVALWIMVVLVNEVKNQILTTSHALAEERLSVNLP